MQKSIKSLKRNGILLLAYDLLVLCIVFVKNGMINMSAEAATSLIVSIGFGIFINLLWIVDSKTWITDYGKRKCIWSYWCGEIVLLLLVVALENMNQLHVIVKNLEKQRKTLFMILKVEIICSVALIIT